MTTAKIAKNANVSPATIYIHYRDKTDLISRVYEEVKASIQSGLSEVINDQDSIDEQVEALLKFIVRGFYKHPDEYNFIKVVWNNQELLDDHAIKFETELNKTLSKLFKRINDDDEYVTVSQPVFDIFFSVPTLILDRDAKIEQNQIDTIIGMVKKAIKK
ncbi:TetR/AcrR family transcriptional regulator [Lactobacillus sp. Sy-1]|uniref:TetR/AcrR family transcriptional regulator n=1 Tax=Lactobacillus sp. Sy-1 TaxID=2109645 RepID=UPI001C5BAC80|nr:TetR/AcrR family transcriptional regulator [Lactobacillus sp. Sy-1]MBW1606404.1 TetR/AcrR family transcriptional regulator [Lactobacillus sp. Sy-1]